MEFSKTGKIILTGDFNARTGNMPDYILNEIDNIPVLDQVVSTSVDCVTRINNDDKTNVYGRKLLNMCINCNINIVNGRTYGDMPGQHTCFQYNGSSVTDYTMVSSDLSKNILYFHVCNPTFLSDYALIEMKLQINLNPPKTCSSLDPIVPSYKWDELSKINFVKTLNSPYIQTEINGMLDKEYCKSDEDCNNIGIHLTTIFQKTADLCLKNLKMSKLCFYITDSKRIFQKYQNYFKNTQETRI